jgi:hypothetical protein
MRRGNSPPPPPPPPPPPHLDSLRRRKFLRKEHGDLFKEETRRPVSFAGHGALDGGSKWLLSVTEAPHLQNAAPSLGANAALKMDAETHHSFCVVRIRKSTPLSFFHFEETVTERSLLLLLLLLSRSAFQIMSM